MTPILRREGVTNQESARDSRQILKTGYPAHSSMADSWFVELVSIRSLQRLPLNTLSLGKKLASKHVDGKTPSGYDIHSLPWKINTHF